MPADKLEITIVRGHWDSEGALSAKVVAQHPRCHGEVDENGFQAERVCGRMYINELERFVAVSGVKVDYYAQRSRLGFKVGTKLYERAAKVACEVAGKPLASDTQRSKIAEAFWKKQEAKGRAHFDADANRYFLRCPAPDLGRARRGRR
jgi:hypothetical protein